MGTLLRTALALGWDGVLLLPGCADPFSDKCLRASRGAAFWIPVVPVAGLEDWERLLQQHQLLPLAGVVRPPAGSAAAPAGASSSSVGDGSSVLGGSSSAGDRGWEQQPGSPSARTRSPAAAAATATTTLAGVQQAAARRRVCLVLGSEGAGVSPAVAQLCAPISIPMPGEMESLNVSASGAVLMFSLGSGVSDLLVQLPGPP